MKKRILTIALLSACLFSGQISETKAQTAEQVFRAAGTPQDPKVPVSWNRYYDYDGLTEICAKLAKAHPDLVKMETIGDSYEGRRLWALTISDFSTGDPDRKPAMYIDGNIHSNEIQGSEFALYTAWYLVENFQDNKFIKELLQQKTFYILPTINPDARNHYMHQANSPHSPRSGMIPLDDDGDGLVDEDRPDDLNKDGHITFMRRKSPNGRYIQDPQNPLRLIPTKPDQPGQYELLGYEGLDNDGDGKVNEDPPGYYDPNRDWAWNWQPDYIQRGAYKYPFSIPENRAVKDFVLRHPNIAGAQSYHNNGGMILRGPGAEEDLNTYNRDDNQVYDLLGKYAEQIIPGYTYMVVYKDLYSAFGGELDWFHGARGIFTFSNELMSPYLQFDRKGTSSVEREAEQYDFNQMLLFNEAFVEWTPFDHPTYGQVEIGGFKKNYPRAHPGFLLEEDAHRNMAFTVYQAFQLPQLVIQEVQTRKLPHGLTEVTATVANTRIIPTHSSQDLKYHIERPDYISLRDSTVVAGMVLENADLNLGKEQKLNPARLEIPNIPGMGYIKVRWIVNANKPNLLVEVDSRKGGVVSRRFEPDVKKTP
ncbi:M14 family metallopeptidase [Rufibacter hautae]|uniref:Peptidase M14 n=1 Tax=Rufibacter hautae TaxID=2595005 RepID=A0A5B6TCE7_9BACT|nr:M14 family metallopeptidase [Rufibacter hautae]KAA3438137.1 peptidase M14 [Rufibacter hautae]